MVPTMILTFMVTIHFAITLSAESQHDPHIPPEELLYTSANNYNVNNEFGKQRSNTKVDVLGSILKNRVTQLRNHPQQEVDLVVLVDSSASVGAENFFNEVKFIRKLLADFTVSVNETRVVIITYSSVDRVLRQVDHMTQPSNDYHKCLLIEEQIPAITYNSGGTYTLGAMMQAIEVFQHGRPKSAKCVFLITDGYSNGGDPVPAADTLKDMGVTIFTFGIRNGNVKELKDIASNPTNEYSFILDSFQEFESLARRALHEDLSPGIYLPQNFSACNRLCDLDEDKSKSSSCCDPLATCSCGTHTGHYACVCPPGHFGRGLLGDCNPCPSGTYKPTTDPGDIRSCVPCPHENQTSEPGSQFLHSCKCKSGYQLRDGRCQLMDCPHLEPPVNGFFVRNICQNLFDSACHIDCSSGFQLEGGSSTRICLPNGQWSGTQPRCALRRCPSLQPPRNGAMTCLPTNSSTTQASNSTSGVLMVVDTECRFTCREGFRLQGAPSRKCLQIGQWLGLPAQCKPIKCPRLRKPSHGEIYPTVCAERKMHFGERCAFACRSGFELQGPSLRECLTQGIWTGGPLTTRCVDITPPTFNCTTDIVTNTEPNLHYAVMNISLPSAEDNSNYRPNVLSVPALTSSSKFKIGTTPVVVSATDLSGNTRKCSFNIKVLDVEPPVVDFCQSPPIFLVDSKDDLDKGFITDIEWTEPIFHDNSLDDISISVEITTNGDPTQGHYVIGETAVAAYTATDSSGNSAICKMQITVQKHHCLLPADPINGHKNCSEAENAVYCTLTCKEGFAFAFQNLEDYFCPTQLAQKLPQSSRTGQGYLVETPGPWLPELNPLPFPDCSIVSHSSMVVTPAIITFEFEENDAIKDVFSSKCDDPTFLKKVSDEVKANVQKQMHKVCGGALYCNITELEAICKEIINDQMVKTNQILGRKKRSEVMSTNFSDWTSPYQSQRSLNIVPDYFVAHI